MEELKRVIRTEITKLFEYILDVAQVAIPPDNYKVFRSRVLKRGNDAIRSLDKFIDDKMEEIPPDECERIKKEFCDKHRGIK